MDECNRHASLAYGGGYPFDGAQAHVATSKNTGHARLEQVRVAAVGPAAGLLEVVTRHNVPTLVRSDVGRQPLGFRVCPDEDEKAPALVPLHRIARDVADVDCDQVL